MKNSGQAEFGGFMAWGHGYSPGMRLGHG